MSDLYFETTEKDVFPNWTNAPEVGLRHIMALIALAPKMGLTGNKQPIVRDKNGQVIDGLVLDSQDSKDLVERLEKYDFSKDWKFHITIGKNQCTISTDQVSRSESWLGAMPRNEENDAAIQDIRNEKSREILKEYGEFRTDYTVVIGLKFNDKAVNNFLGVLLDLLTSDDTNIQMIVADEYFDLELMREVEQAVKSRTNTEGGLKTLVRSQVLDHKQHEFGDSC